MQQIYNTLAKDPVMAALIGKYGKLSITPDSDPFESLASQIVMQQLSMKAGYTIWKRLLALTGTPITPAAVLAADPDDMRAAGLSYRKAEYLKALSAAVTDNTIDLSALRDLPDEEVIQALVKIKGIGRWSAEMFLIFCLSRPDVYSLGDGGLTNAAFRLYALENKQQLEQLSNTWAPYRSYASLYLWKSLENQPKFD